MMRASRVASAPIMAATAVSIKTGATADWTLCTMLAELIMMWLVFHEKNGAISIRHARYIS
jgi:hypothetical protein